MLCSFLRVFSIKEHFIGEEEKFHVLHCLLPIRLSFIKYHVITYHVSVYFHSAIFLSFLLFAFASTKFRLISISPYVICYSIDTAFTTSYNLSISTIFILFISFSYSSSNNESTFISSSTRSTATLTSNHNMRQLFQFIRRCWRSCRNRRHQWFRLHKLIHRIES